MQKKASIANQENDVKIKIEPVKPFGIYTETIETEPDGKQNSIRKTILSRTKKKCVFSKREISIDTNYRAFKVKCKNQNFTGIDT